MSLSLVIIEQPIFEFLLHHYKHIEALADFVDLCDIYVSIVI